jgi:hypothetical protein
MHERYLRRKQAARAAKKAAEGRWGLMDPLFNIREFVKQLLLLEDHLAHPHKRCQDCIRKHLLTAEALAEEAAALDAPGGIRQGCEMLAESIRAWIENFQDAQDSDEWARIGQQVRHLRKGLTPLVFDPRGDSATRVASVYESRNICPHK